MELSEKLKTYRISPAEYEHIKELLGREPEGVEWAVFSALWSEHCSYKSSKVHLKKLFSESERVLQSFGENAGIVDLGQGEKVAFKMESHNHPSFIEPYQGAATGVGGILRDIFTMGARPIALANYLCFGESDAPRMEELVNGVVRGIGGYGNCVGVPTITGQTNFHKSYNGNILVNAMAVGLFTEDDPICLSKAKGVGNLVVYVGAKTGRDGVHGASMASESFDEDSESKRPTVQIGDPFFEKLLIESCLEVMKQDLVVAIQDMGAAGLTSSSFEMADKGNVGLTLRLDEVPLRDQTMTPEDVLLSESQERMLLICEPAKLEELQKVFHHWGLDAVAVGEVIEEPIVRLIWKGETLTEMSPKMVVDNAPQYERPYDSWTSKGKESIESKTTLDEKEFLNTMASVEAGTKEWIYKQYDQRVGAATARDCSSPVGVVALPSGRALSVVLGCRPHVMRQDAWLGGVDTIAYPAIEMASKGFEALATTDCLNFGNPEKKEVMSEFVASLDGMNKACEAFVTPIISGNVSFYNETLDKGVSPTPSTGLIGLRDTVEAIPQSSFVNEGDTVVVVTLAKGLSEGYGAEKTGGEASFQWTADLKELAQKTSQLRDVANSGLVNASRIVGNFGPLYTLARMGLANSMGVEVKTDAAANLEPFYQVVLTCEGKNKAQLLDLLKEKGLDAAEWGQVKGQKLKWNDAEFSMTELKELYEKSWSKAFPRLS